jgi:hypothetical protein
VAVPVWLYWTLRSIQFWARAMTSALLMGSLGAALAGAAGTAVTATAINVVARVDRSMVRRDIVDISFLLLGCRREPFPRCGVKCSGDAEPAISD